jgi:hypothetical protein
VGDLLHQLFDADHNDPGEDPHGVTSLRMASLATLSAERPMGY